MRVNDPDFIPPLYSSPACEERPFHFVAAELLDQFDMASLLEYVSGKTVPVVKGFEYPIYSWDFFKWMRNVAMAKPVERSIDKIGIGYCGACGEFITFKRDKKGRWSCPKCGYKSMRIYDSGYRSRAKATADFLGERNV